MERRGAGVLGDPDRLGDRVAGAHDEVAAALPELASEVGEALVEEPGAVGREPGQGRVQDVEGHHPFRAAGRGEGRVVMHPQVAGEQDDRGTHQAAGWTGVPGRVSRLRTATAARRRLGTVARRAKTSWSSASISSRMPP